MNRSPQNDDSPGPAVAEAEPPQAEVTPDATTEAPEAVPQPDGRGRVCPRWLMPMTVGCGVLAAAAWFVDQGLTDRLADEQVREAIKYVLAVPLSAGGYILLLALLGSFPNGGRLCIGFMAAMISSTLITHVIKFVVGRARPDMCVGPLVFKPLNWMGEYQSFPSGHSSAAVALALLLGIYFPRFRWVFYLSAAWVAFDRVIHNRHFTSDVLAGAAIGALAVYLCVRWLGDDFFVKERVAKRGFRIKVEGPAES